MMIFHDFPSHTLPILHGIFHQSPPFTVAFHGLRPLFLHGLAGKGRHAVRQASQLRDVGGPEIPPGGALPTVGPRREYSWGPVYTYIDIYAYEW